MTEKELRKLKRSDFLQLLITQGKDLSAVQARFDEQAAELEKLQAVSEDLRAKLGEKDELIKELKGQLDNKEATVLALRQEIEDMMAIMKAIRWTQSESDGSVCVVPQSLDEIFEAVRGAKADTGRQNRRRSRGKR